MKMRKHGRSPEQKDGRSAYKKSSTKGAISTIVMVVAFAGLMIVGWMAFEETTFPKQEAELPVIHREGTPFKVKPVSPGGMEIPNRDKQVFSAVTATPIVAVSEETERSVRLLPPPEEPLSVEEIESTKAKDLPKDVLAILDEDTSSIRQRFSAPPAEAPDEEPLKDARSESKGAKNKQNVAHAPDIMDSKAVEKSLPGSNVDTRKMAAKEKPLTITFSGDEKKDTVKDDAPLVLKRKNPIARPYVQYSSKTGHKIIALAALANKPSRYQHVKKADYTPSLVHSARKVNAITGVRVQLGAFRSVESLQKNWSSLKSKHSALGRYDYGIQKVDLGANGIFYRLQAGPMRDIATATQLCKTLKRHQVGCFVVRE